MAGFKIDPRLLRFGGEALQDLGYGLARAPDIGQAFGVATQRMAEAQPARDAYAASEAEKAERLKQINVTAEALKQWPDLVKLAEAGNDMAPLLSEAFKRMSPGYGQTAQADLPASIQEYQFAKDQGFTGSFMDFQTQRGGAAEVSLTPTWGIDTDPNSPTYNKPVLGQLNKAGKFVKTELPAGVQPMDPGQLAGVRTEATVDAKTAGAARAALPGAQQQRDVALKGIELVTTDEKGLGEQFGTILGVPQRNLPVYPGSALGNWQANFQQVKDQAFLQARQFLKGQGAITEMESAKAEGAYSRMEAAAKSGDKGTFLAAAEDFKDAINDGYAKLEQTAAGGYAAGAAAPASSDAGAGWKVVGVR